MNAVTDIYSSRGLREASVTPRMDPVVYAQDTGGSPVDIDTVGKYRTDGFLLLEGVFSPEEILSFQEEMSRLRDNPMLASKEETITEPGSGEIRSIFKVHAFSQLFARLAADERLAGLARYILDDDVYLHQSRLNYKPGFRGKEFYWHSDFETWHMEDGMPRMRALSISISLTENFASNGPLMLIPGSHMKYVVCPGETPENHYKKSLKKQEYGVPDDDNLAQLVREHGIRMATGPAGAVTVFDCNTMHGSNGNISPYPRSNVFFVYNAWSNRLERPYSGQAPRPEYIATRKHPEIIKP